MSLQSSLTLLCWREIIGTEVYHHHVALTFDKAHCMEEVNIVRFICPAKCMNPEHSEIVQSRVCKNIRVLFLSGVKLLAADETASTPSSYLVIA